MAMNPLYSTELETIENVERFQVTDLSSLNWAMRKLTAIEAKKREIRNMIEDEMERLKLFLEKETSGLTDSENFFKSLISEYAAEKRMEDPSYKIKTPYGRVAYRKVPDKWSYNEDLLVAYLEQNDYHELIRTKKEPIKTVIKSNFNVNDGRVFDDNGQEVAGIKIEQQDDVLIISTEV